MQYISIINLFLPGIHLFYYFIILFILLLLLLLIMKY